MGDLIIGAINITMFIGAIYGACYVIRVIAEWRIFSKAGEKGWKTFIPFYNVYTEYKLTSNMKWFAIYMFAVIFAALLQEFAGEAEIHKTLTAIANAFVSIVTVKRWYSLSKAFGKGIGFTIGLALLHPLFIVILGIGKSKYIGPADK